MKKFLLTSIFLSTVLSAQAVIEPTNFDNPQLQQRYQHLIDELRCPKCQNQNLSGSDAPIAQDLRHRVADMLKAGDSDRQIIDFLRQRYGDFITYDPPLNAATVLLWFGPLMALLIIGWSLMHWIRNQKTETPLASEDQQRLQALLDDMEEKP